MDRDRRRQQSVEFRAQRDTNRLHNLLIAILPFGKQRQPHDIDKTLAKLQRRQSKRITNDGKDHHIFRPKRP
mgnify:CR=1 FL=1